MAKPFVSMDRRSQGEMGQAVNASYCFARGDGIGPEIMDAALRILEAAAPGMNGREVSMGESVYKSGVMSGIGEDAWSALRQHRVLLKAPIATPRGGGYKSLNVTIRKSFGLYANVRPCQSFYPFVQTLHPNLDVVIVRENEEDTYGGIEHRQTREVTQCLKLITRPGCERVIRFAFEYAKRHERRKVTCMVKDNIMKITDGLFHQVFEEVAREYPGIETEAQIIDIGAANLATKPRKFDVVVTTNLYGDIISDVAAQAAGSVGLAGSANIGDGFAMFEAIHGSAPDIAGNNIANPSGLINAMVMMLLHLGKPAQASMIQNAWLRTIEDGVHTSDLFQAGVSRKRVSTDEFAAAVIDRLGLEPKTLRPRRYSSRHLNQEWPNLEPPRAREDKQLVGVDVFVDWDEASRDPNVLARGLEAAMGNEWTLKMITNRGVKVYPNGLPETFRTDHWRCRFVPRDKSKPVPHAMVIGLLMRLAGAKFDFIKTENLYTFDGEPGYSMGQGE